MEQYCQLSSHGNYRSFLGIFSSSLCKLQSPSPQITVFSKRSQNVMRSLHHHRSQIPSPSLLIFFCGSLSPEFLRPGRNPRKQPTARLFGNRYGSSIVRTYVSAIWVPTPFTCLSKPTSGYTSLALFSIRSSYSLMLSFSDSTSLSNGSR